MPIGKLTRLCYSGFHQISKPMTMKEKEVIEYLKQQQENSDTEDSHINADNILCEFLIELGFERIVEEFEKVNKWYC
jgi:hypothetical protein